MDTAVSVQPYFVEISRVLLEKLICALVDQPNLVSVKSVTQADQTGLTVMVSGKDFGKVIGKQGRTARSLRTIFAAISRKYDHRFLLDLQDSGGSLPDPTHELAAMGDLVLREGND